MKKYLKLLILSSLALMVSQTLVAQMTLSSVRGRVMDGSAPVANVEIVVTHDLTGVQYCVETDENGRFRVLDIVPGGPYTIIFQQFGYRPVAVRGLSLKISENKELNIGLTPSDEEDESTILLPRSYAQALSTTGSATTTAFSSEEISRLPNARRNSLDEFLKIAPLYSLESNYVDSYHNSSENLDQVAVINNPFDGRLGGTSGVSVLTRMKSGTNDFHFSVYDNFLFRNGTNLTGASLSGAFIRDKLHYFLDAEYDFAGTAAAFLNLDWNIVGGHRLSLEYSGKFGSCHDFDLGWSSHFAGGKGANVLDVSCNYYPYVDGSKILAYAASDDFSFSAGKNLVQAGARFRYLNSYYEAYAYVQDELLIADSFTLMPGVSAYGTSESGFTVFPRFNFNWSIIGERMLALRGGAGYRAGFSGTDVSLLNGALAADVRLPMNFRLTVEGGGAADFSGIDEGRSTGWNYYATARIDRTFYKNLYVNASYTRAGSSGDMAVSPNNVAAAVSYRIPEGDNLATLVSLSYHGCHCGFTSDGRLISRYSYYENVGGELSLLTIPNERQLTRRDFVSEENREAFLRKILSTPYLNANQGMIAKEGGAVAPWRNVFNVKVEQEFRFNIGSRENLVRLGVDCSNLANFINSEYGSIRSSSGSVLLSRENPFSGYIFDETADVWSPVPDLRTGGALLVCLKYIF